MNTTNHSQTAAFLWSIADLLRGDFKQSQYGWIILPFTLLRRLECLLEPTKHKVKKQVTDEHKQQGFNGRFGPGLPRVSDGSLLFLLHLVSKMCDPREGGSRIGIILNGSPLFTGGAGSGESEIRRYLLQNDLVEAIVALPTDMFYNTGIATYVWVLSNHKPQNRRGKVQLIDGTGQFSKMRKSLGSKRQYLDDAQIDALVRLYGRFEETPQSKIFPVEAFGYRRITI
jgi:type I restriction enzyme M protein